LLRTPDRECEGDIKKDVERTFPGNPEFQLPCSSGNNKLYNILKAYSQHDLEVGYCQGTVKKEHRYELYCWYAITSPM